LFGFEHIYRHIAEHFSSCLAVEFNGTEDATLKAVSCYRDLHYMCESEWTLLSECTYV